MERLQRIMLVNGFLVILFAMLAGLMLTFSLLGGLEIWPENIYRLRFTAPLTDGFERIQVGL